MYPFKIDYMNYPLNIDILAALADGNIGAISVLDKMLISHDFSRADRAIRNLIKYKIMGSMIWVGYKDACGEDVLLFIDKLIQVDPALFSCMIQERKQI